METDKPQVNLDFATNAKPYRSKFKAKALQLAVPDAKDGDTIKIPINGRAMAARPGDYVVQLEDGRLELWDRDRFEREFELEAPAGRTIEVDL